MVVCNVSESQHVSALSLLTACRNGVGRFAGCRVNEPSPRFFDSYAAERRIVDEHQRLHFVGLALANPRHPVHSHDPRIRHATRSAIISFKKLRTRRSSLRSQFIASITLKTPAPYLGLERRAEATKALARRRGGRRETRVKGTAGRSLGVSAKSTVRTYNPYCS